MPGAASPSRLVCVVAFAVVLAACLAAPGRAADPMLSFRVPIASVKPGARYRVYLRGINDIHGNRISRQATVIGMRPAVWPR